MSSKTIFPMKNAQKLNEVVEKAINDTELHFDIDENLEKSRGDVLSEPQLNSKELKQLLDVTILDEAKYAGNALSDAPAMSVGSMPAVIDAGTGLPEKNKVMPELSQDVYQRIIKRMTHDKNLHRACRACKFDQAYVDNLLKKDG